MLFFFMLVRIGELDDDVARHAVLIATFRIGSISFHSNGAPTSDVVGHGDL